MASLPPLNPQQHITNEDGTPTPQFIQWAQQQRAVNEDAPDLTDPQGVSDVIDVLEDPAPASQGSILFRGSTRWRNLAAGTANRFLQTKGPGQNPIWALATWLGLSDTPGSFVGEAGRTLIVNPGESGLIFADAGSASTTVITVVATSYTAAAISTILVDDDAAGGVVTISLPSLSGILGRIYNIKKLGTTANVIVDGDGTETIDGATTFTIATQYDSVTIVAGASEWSII